MLVIIGNNEQQIETSKVTIQVNYIEYRIRIDPKGGIEINKYDFERSEDSIIVKPYVTNQVTII